MSGRVDYVIAKIWHPEKSSVVEEDQGNSAADDAK